MRGSDWLILAGKRVEAEQRLWESGPLGRAWLKIRKSLTLRR